MSTLDTAGYTEATELDLPRNVDLSHLSIEVGHFYMEDLLNGEDRMRAQFLRIAPWIDAARRSVAVGLGDRTLRVSTCFLIDDYFRSDTDPSKIVEKLIRISGECGVTIDYLAREAGCWEAGRIPLAEMVAAMLLPEPPVGTNGSRPPVRDSGWLCNGERSPHNEAVSEQAMQVGRWRPPEQFGARNHSIFLDVELWRDAIELVDGSPKSKRTWSCPFLASIWQLLRLGMLRSYGEPVVQPEPRSVAGHWPDSWAELPPVTKLNPAAAPFAAFRTTSILPHIYLGIEHAVDVILAHLKLDPQVEKLLAERGEQERLGLPDKVVNRITHVFIDAGDADSTTDSGKQNADCG